MPRMGTLQLAAVVLTLVGLGAIRFELVDAGGGKTKPQLGHPDGHAFTDEDRARIKKAALAHLAAEHKGDVMATLHVSSHAIREAKETPESLQKHEAQALVFNYTKGKAFRVSIDPQTGKVTQQTEVTGMILSSPEEREEGRKIVLAFAEHAKFAKAGALAEGGFAVQTPKGLEATKVPHRYLEYHLTSADHKTLERVVIVDLSDKKVASSKAP